MWFSIIFMLSSRTVLGPNHHVISNGPRTGEILKHIAFQLKVVRFLPAVEITRMRLFEVSESPKGYKLRETPNDKDVVVRNDIFNSYMPL
jgi:hypothetical protein